MPPDHFTTITGSDWAVSLKAARARRAINQKLMSEKINHMKRGPKPKEYSRAPSNDHERTD